MSSPAAAAYFPTEITPGPTVTDDDLPTYVLYNTGAAAHWVGTAKLGNVGDKTAVVDPQLRVLGVDNLRIGDCSVLPSTNTHTQASGAMAGERVASFILTGA